MEPFYPNSDEYPYTDADMNQRNWLVARWSVALAYSAIVLIPVAMLLAYGFQLGWLPAVMALGPLLAGIWLFISIRSATKLLPLDEAEPLEQTSKDLLMSALIVMVVIFAVAWFAIWIGSASTI
ncbi:MAG: hypothetical protein ABI716_02430, partial [Candidatus Saccharibacteria bacterium]